MILSPTHTHTVQCDDVEPIWQSCYGLLFLVLEITGNIATCDDELA